MSDSYKIVDMSITETIHHSGEDVPVKVLPVTDYSSTITVKAKGNGSDLTWKAAYYRGYMNNNPPEALNEAAAKSAVQALFRAGLDNLKAMVESNEPINNSGTATESISSSTEEDTASTVEKSASNFDSKYPAANFEPKVIFIDKKLASSNVANIKKKKVVFDPKYPAANFEPKIIYP